MSATVSRRTWDGLDALEGALGRVRSRIAAGLEGSGTTARQLKVLRILRGMADQGMPTLSVARAMGDGSPGITRLIDRLERRGLVTRTRDGSDRRQVTCTITAAGVRAVEVADEALSASVEQAFRSLTHHEIGALIHMLSRIR